MSNTLAITIVIGLGDQEVQRADVAEHEVAARLDLGEQRPALAAQGRLVERAAEAQLGVDERAALREQRGGRDGDQPDADDDRDRERVANQPTVIVPGAPATRRPTTVPGTSAARWGSRVTRRPPEVIASQTSHLCGGGMRSPQVVKVSA